MTLGWLWSHPSAGWTSCYPLTGPGHAAPCGVGMEVGEMSPAPVSAGTAHKPGEHFAWCQAHMSGLMDNTRRVEQAMMVFRLHILSCASVSPFTPPLSCGVTSLSSSLCKPAHSSTQTPSTVLRPWV